MPSHHHHLHHMHQHNSASLLPTTTTSDEYKQQQFSNTQHINNGYNLHQSATNRSSHSVDAKVNQINPKIVRFSSRMNTIDQYTPYPNAQPLKLSNTNSKSSAISINSIPSIPTPSKSSSTHSISSKQWTKLQLNSTNTQSSTSFT